MRVAGISLVKNIDRVVRRGVALHLTCSKDCIYSPRAAGLRLTRQNLYLNQVFLYLKSDHTKSWRNFSHGNRTTRAGGSTATPTSCAVDVHVSPIPSPLVVVISGPSGVGKDAVIRRLQSRRPDIYFVVTATSRPMRPGERDGVDYYFVTRETFEKWIATDQLLEHAVVYGEYKGIPRRQVEEAIGRGNDVVLRVDVQGAATVRNLLSDIVTIFLVAESQEELVKRLVARKTEPEDKMRVRVATAKTEMARVSEFEYVVVNKDGELDRTVEQIEAIITAEKARVHRRITATESNCQSC